MKKYIIPILGGILAAIGTFSELSVAPAGAALAFTGILGLVTLWKSRNEVGLRIRKRAFYVSALLSGILVLHYVLSFKSSPESIEPWARNTFASAYIVSVISLVCAATYGWFAFKNRSKERRGKVSSLVSFVASTVTCLVFALMGVSTVLFSTVVVGQAIMANLSPPVSRMLSSMAQDQKALSDVVSKKDGILTVKTSDPSGDYTWECENQNEISVMGVGFPVNDTDKMVMRKLCDRTL